MSTELTTAIEAAKIGAKAALRYFNTDIKIEYKEDQSPVTIADRESEQAIKNYIASRFPHAKFLAEESSRDIHEKEFWIIDPVDGTSSFMKGIPFWFVLVSLFKEGTMQLGACYFPLLKQTLYAERNKGAFLDEEEVHVSKTKELGDAYVSFSSLRNFTQDTYKQGILTLSAKSKLARSPEPTISAFFLAQGKYDVLVDANAKAWDTAPFKVIIEEAGGKVTNMDGNEWGFNDKGFIATNGLLHDEVIKILEGK